ncbi:bifunctional aspartate kinase/homoserine dehydrogenase I [Myroides sp. LJL115]
MKVIKFGGSSVANAKNIKRCIDIILQIDKPVVVVVSALKGVTDLLQIASIKASNKDNSYLEDLQNITQKHLEIVKELIPVNLQPSVMSHILCELNNLEAILQGCFLLQELSPRVEDLILSYGENLSAYLINQVLVGLDKDSICLDSGDLIKTDAKYSNAKVDFEKSNALILRFFCSHSHAIYLMPGFCAKSHENQVTTLGRGGSDYTATILGSALMVENVEIYTDVNGIYTANPAMVKQASILPHISFDQAMELSHFGAKVLYPSALIPLLHKNIPLLVKNTFDPYGKASIVSQDKSLNCNEISGISNIDNLALLTLEGPGMVGVAGISKRLFEQLSKADINVIFITQASSEHSICFAILQKHALKAQALINVEFATEIKEKKVKPLRIEKDKSIVAIVGNQIKENTGVAGRMFSALGRNNINICAIAQGASQNNISVVIDQKDVFQSLNILHEEFFEQASVQLNLFVMGLGNVGYDFVEQILKQQNYLLENFKINVRIIGLANSKKMAFNVDGFNKENIKNPFSDDQKMDQKLFIERIKSLNLRNSVFVDNTANQEVALSYPQFLKNSIAIVTCNKIANSLDMAYYKELKALSKKHNAPFLYETNVGAGLPIIDTIKNLIASGDKVLKIQAVLSGSLNFIFNEYNATESFAKVVQKAKDNGYTEPNPFLDLSGVDIQRKIMILIREANYSIEQQDIAIESFLPQSCLHTKSVEEFIQALEQEEPYFRDLYLKAQQNNARLKVVATFEEQKAVIKLEQVAIHEPYYNLEGKDNIILLSTNRYNPEPLIIKGAGAGKEVTASGLFADVIRIGNKLV